MTHANAHASNLADIDNDNVPDDWEIDVGLLVVGTRRGNQVAPQDSFQRFTGSGPGVRDQEYYAWLNAAFGPAHYNGSHMISRRVPTNARERAQFRRNAGQLNAVPAGNYHGMIPAASDRDRDWARDGFRWETHVGAILNPNP